MHQDAGELGLYHGLSVNIKAMLSAGHVDANVVTLLSL